jgi:hypothetical protein
MRNKIDNLKFQIRLKDTDIKNAAEENQTLNNQNKELRLVTPERECIYDICIDEAFFL